MPSLRDTLDDLEAFFERSNARHDAVARARPAWWNVGKIVLGLLCLARGVSHAVHATGFWSYALAALLLIGGAYLAQEGATLLRAKIATRKT